MNRIFLILSIAANLALMLTFVLGWRIEDAASIAESARQQVSLHFLFALASVMFALLIHAIVLTYFMGTGRWIEETSAAYRFEPTARKENIRLKYKVIPGMMTCFLLLIGTGAFGAIADPASSTRMDSAVMIHFLLAVTTIVVNVLVSFWEYQQISENSILVDRVYQEVQLVRRERGLDQTAPSS